MARFRSLPRSFYLRAPEVVARDLLGRYLVRELEGERLVVRLNETEAYLGAEDRAAHTFGGRRTERVRSMYKGGGFAYVYFTYGMHFCLNVVVGPADSGQAVLLRGGDPVEGEAAMRKSRGLASRAKPALVAGGPARLCEALAIDRTLDGATLLRGELRITEGEPESVRSVEVTPRIGVAYAGEAALWPLRFVAISSDILAAPSVRSSRARVASRP